MSDEFKREDRYMVFKISDVVEHCTKTEALHLARLYEIQRVGRKDAGKAELECVVVESDWPEYEPTWKAIEARVTGAQPAPSMPNSLPVYADPFTYIIQHLNSNPYSLTKDECVTLIKELRDLYNAAPKAKT